MPQVIDPQHLKKAQRFKQRLARYQQARDLISVGAYMKGSDPLTDFAVERIERMQLFLRQGLNERATHLVSVAQMKSTIEPDQMSNPEKS